MLSAVRALVAREVAARAAAAAAAGAAASGTGGSSATAAAAAAVPAALRSGLAAPQNHALYAGFHASALASAAKEAKGAATATSKAGAAKADNSSSSTGRRTRIRSSSNSSPAAATTTTTPSSTSYDPEHATGPGPRLFSIRPSALSPLHAQHRENEVLAERADFAALTLVAQARLATAVDAGRAAATAASSPSSSGSGNNPSSADLALADALAARRAELERAADAYEQLLAAAGPAPPPSHVTARTAAGYWALLEQQTQERDSGCLDLAAVLAGDRGVWDYWFEDFERRYAGLPSLPPLSRLFAGGAGSGAAAGAASPGEAGAQQGAGGAAAEARALRREALARLALPPQQPRQPRVDALGRARGLGRRKTAVAQAVVWRKPVAGEGEGAGGAASTSPSGGSTIVVNRRPVDEFFGDVHARARALRPLLLAGAAGGVDAAVRVVGGGTGGQAGAVAHALARALQALDPARYRSLLRASGLLKRDPRMVERKKPGRKKARKSFAWVKR
jgi:small subunit ribosomal protein S9